jgi:hypothetical protein
VAREVEEDSLRAAVSAAAKVVLAANAVQGVVEKADKVALVAAVAGEVRADLETATVAGEETVGLVRAVAWEWLGAWLWGKVWLSAEGMVELHARLSGRPT